MLNIVAICSLLLLYNILLSEYTTTYLTILNSGYFGCFQILVLINFFKLLYVVFQVRFGKQNTIIFNM